MLPLTTPEVVLGSSLLSLFLDLNVRTGFATIVIAHIMFSVSYVALTVRARIRGFDWTLEEAAMDLGAPPFRVFSKVTLPIIAPGIVAAAMLAFALSLDDFIITLFNAGNRVTYPLYVYGARRAAFPPQINVLATAILLVSLLALGATVLWQQRTAPAAGDERHAPGLTPVPPCNPSSRPATGSRGARPASHTALEGAGTTPTSSSWAPASPASGPRCSSSQLDPSAAVAVVEQGAGGLRRERPQRRHAVGDGRPRPRPRDRSTSARPRPAGWRRWASATSPT